MAPRVLPWWPHILFGVLEPLALLLGAYTIAQSPQNYNDVQVPSAILHLPISAGTMVLTLQLGNIFLLLAAIAILCCFTTHPDIARNYLSIVAFADLGHMYSCYCGMGNSFWDVGRWNSMAWGNIGTSAFLCVNRVSTVLGVFGPVRNQAAVKRE